MPLLSLVLPFVLGLRRGARAVVRRVPARAVRIAFAATALLASAHAPAQGVLQASMAFLPSTIVAGDPTLLRITLDNTESSTVTRGVGYEVLYPAGMRLVEAPSGKQCGGRIRFDSFGYSFRLKRLQPGAVCDVFVSVTVDSIVSRDITLVVGPIRAKNAVGVSQIFADLSVIGAQPPGSGPRIVNVPPLAPPLAINVPVSIAIDVVGGVRPYAFDIAAGALPPGLGISQDGRIAGTPTTPGSYSFAVRVRDAGGREDVREFSLDVTRIETTLAASLAPNPVVEGQLMTLTATVSSSRGVPDGIAEVWIAGKDTRCPNPFESGPAPVVPVAGTVTFVGGSAQIGFSDLSVGAYRVCVRYAGTPTFLPSSKGPIDLFVIKGIVLQ